MTVRERILAIRLLEKQKKCPEYTRRIGIQVQMENKIRRMMEERKCSN
jgi:hypothetical protein